MAVAEGQPTAPIVVCAGVVNPLCLSATDRETAIVDAVGVLVDGEKYHRRTDFAKITHFSECCIWSVVLVLSMGAGQPGTCCGRVRGAAIWSTVIERQVDGPDSLIHRNAACRRNDTTKVGENVSVVQADAWIGGTFEYVH